MPTRKVFRICFSERVDGSLAGSGRGLVLLSVSGDQTLNVLSVGANRQT